MKKLESLSKSKNKHVCFDSQLSPYLVTSAINSYAKKEFPGQLEVKQGKKGGQIFVYI